MSSMRRYFTCVEPLPRELEVVKTECNLQVRCYPFSLKVSMGAKLEISLVFRRSLRLKLLQGDRREFSK